MIACRPFRWPVRLMLVVVGLVTTACGQADSGNTATAPAPREEDYWMKLHQQYVDRAKKGEVGVLFLGDSITQGWFDNVTWKRFYGPRHAANFGIGGDRTQHVLWRIDNGEIEGLSPKAVVLMIGTNNIGSNTPAQIADGVKEIVGRLRKKLPDARILLLGVFPRGAAHDKAAETVDVDPRPAQINQLIQELAADKMVTYLDISKSFLNSDGKIPKWLMPDFLHLSDEGYRAWADAMEPALWEITHADGR